MEIIKHLKVKTSKDQRLVGASAPAFNIHYKHGQISTSDDHRPGRSLKSLFHK